MNTLRHFVWALVLLPAFLTAQGGMWMPLHLKLNNERDMKSLGLKISADDIYHPEKASIKDAICQFSGGCTGEIISPQGLLLTNHHCGFDAIQNHSTLENNYVDNGFWAKDKASELSCPGATAMFVRRIEDVTALMLRGVEIDMSERDRQAAIDANMAQVRKTNEPRLKRGEELMIRSFYNGNQYFMYTTVTYKDVRLVGAPPSSIGKFGADTDNWVWPRHTGDFAMFRVYMTPDSQVSSGYDAKNIPLIPRHYLPISLDGAEEGDFTMVYGFPGRTDEYLSAAAVQQAGEVLNPARVAVRDRTLKILDGYMRRDPGIKIAYIAKQSNIANAWKKWLGEMQGLRTYGAVEKKRAYEAEFTKLVSGSPKWNPLYGNLLPRLESNIKTIEPYALTRDYYLEVFVRNCESMSRVSTMDAWIASYKSQGPAAFMGKISAQRASLKEFYKEYAPRVDQDVFAGLMEIYAQNVRDEWGTSIIKAEVAKHGSYAAFAEYIYKNSIVADSTKMLSLLDKGIVDLHTTLENDPAIVYWRAVSSVYQAQVAPKLQETQPLINAIQRQYMAAQMAVFKDKKFFPDANSTLRVTYGQVRGFRPRDGIVYDHRTYLDGVVEKYVPGDYEFDVPKKLIQLHKNKDYGPYATRDGRMPVAFLGSNHTTGGNSGSPALNAKGHLVGLNFDRVWEGTMSDLNYDPAVCRNIMVDARYILFIVDKYAGATHLINEMTLVQGKKKK
jgi:hypothetical protein